MKQDGAPIAFIALIDYETHGYHYLRSVHGPAWLDKPSTQLEAQVRDLLVEDVRKRDKNVVFLRIDLWNFEGSFPVLSTVPYNETVYVDITGGDEAILTRMKKRGRRDVRKALRESPAVCADETAQAMADFSEYYEVMVDTANRDGFSPAPMSDYVDMISILVLIMRAYSRHVSTARSWHGPSSPSTAITRSITMPVCVRKSCASMFPTN